MASGHSEISIIESLKSMTQEIIKPEPEFTTFTKYLAKYYNDKLDQKQALVHLVNSHGLHLRNDLMYLSDKREENMCDGMKKPAPVLNVSDLNLLDNYDDILEKIKELPEEWTVIQVTKRFIPLDMLKELENSWDPGVFITRFSCGKLAERLNPYYILTESRSQIDESFMQLLKDLFKIRREYYISGGTNRKIKEEYSNTDSGLMKFIFEMENHWLKEWRCLLGGRLEDKNLETETVEQVKKAVNNFLQKTKSKSRLTEESIDIIYQVTLSAHLLKNKEILMVLNHVLYNGKLERLNDMAPLMEDLKGINLGNSCAVKRAEKNPVILIVDKEFELIPWEMVSLLNGQPVCRISSFHMLYALFKYHEVHITKGYRRVKIDCGYGLINPDKDLYECEREIRKFLETRMPWIETDIGTVPDPKILVSRFQDTDVFIYCGHGSGTQYLKSGDLKKALVRGIVLLFGCSSNLPKSAGGRTPYNNETYTYITNGCPCSIGCIYDIVSCDADSACKEILSSFLPALRKKDSGLVIEMPEESDVLRGVLAGKMACRKYWSKCAFVARGIPCKTVKGNIHYCTKHIW